MNFDAFLDPLDEAERRILPVFVAQAPEHIARRNTVRCDEPCVRKTIEDIVTWRAIRGLVFDGDPSQGIVGAD